MSGRWKPILLPVLLVLACSVTGGSQSTGSLRFRFAFGAVTGSGANQKVMSVTQDVALKSGDKIKLMVELQLPGFVYLLHRGPRNEVDLLLPADLKQALDPARKYYVPGGSEWLELDQNTGSETFYLLASTRRLTGLESMLSRYAAAAPPARAPISSEIVAEIRRLRAESRAAGVPAERPVMIGGNVRSLDPLPDVATLAVEIAAQDFYARTFTIDHR